MIATLLRRLSLALYRAGDYADRAAERLAPSVKPASDYVELCTALRVEKFAELEAEAARQQERVVRHMRVIPGGAR